MSGKFLQGVFTPKHPERLISKKPIIYRSSWEYDFLRNFLDSHPSVLKYGSECEKISYYNPFLLQPNGKLGKWTFYIPDFVINYIDVNNKQHIDLVEIKPMKESIDYKGKVSQNTKMIQAINAAKWNAAILYCRARKWTFRVLTEKDLYGLKRHK